MRILYIASSSGWGGGSAALFNLLRGMRLHGHEIMVLFPKEGDGRFCKELDDIGVGYSFSNYGLTIYPRTRNPLKYMVRLFRILKNQSVTRHKITHLIDSFKPDIVHTNVGPMDIALTPCLKKNVPHVWHLREYQDLDFGMTSIPSKSYFIHRIHREGNYNIAITKGVFSYWGLNPQKDVTIYDGVFTEKYKTISCSKENIILFAGRVEEAKGVYYILKPFSRLHKRYSNYKLIIAGRYQVNSNYYLKCQTLIDLLGIKDSVVFLGEITNVYEWMARARTLVVPSRFEGFGFITAEAMLNGCFVVGRNTAGTKEQFDKCLESTGMECGFRFMDEDGLYDGLLYAVEHDTSKQCRLAQSVVMENYSLEKHCAKVEDYYKRVLSQLSD